MFSLCDSDRYNNQIYLNTQNDLKNCIKLNLLSIV